jgi:hypothetical protein
MKSFIWTVLSLAVAQLQELKDAQKVVEAEFNSITIQTEEASRQGAIKQAVRLDGALS